MHKMQKIIQNIITYLNTIKPSTYLITKHIQHYIHTYLLYIHMYKYIYKIKYYRRGPACVGCLAPPSWPGYPLGLVACIAYVFQ